MDTATVMVVDDAPANLMLLRRMIENGRYRVLTFDHGFDALQAAAEIMPDAVILDINMPDIDGYEVCRRLKAEETLNEIPVLFVSGYISCEEKIRAFKAGGVDYITKPFDGTEINTRLDTHIKLSRLQKGLRRQNEDLEALVAKKVEEVYSAQLSTIRALAKLAEHRDNDTGRHLERVQRYTDLIARQLRKRGSHPEIAEDRFVYNLFHASPLHDIGKVAIPDHILLKPSELDPAEFELMKTHTTVGFATLESVYADHPENEYLSVGMAVARSHHERWDGKGYPDGSAEDAIPLAARIMAIADVYDALRSKRVYKPAGSHNETLEIIREGSGSQFDPTVVNAFLSIEEDFAEIATTMV